MVQSICVKCAEQTTTEMEGRLLFARDRREEGMGVTTVDYGVPCCGDSHVLELDADGGCTTL